MKRASVVSRLRFGWRRRESGATQIRTWTTRQFLACGMSVTVALSGLQTSVQKTPRSIPLDQVADAHRRLHDAASAPRYGEDVLQALETLNSASFRTAIDVPAKARELGPDVSRIFSFVRDNVRYEVYEGALRGPRGALMAMAGNAYDKSLLLGALLGAHGIQVRYVRGRLDRTRAAALVGQMFPRARPQSRGPDPATLLTESEVVRRGLMTIAARRWSTSVDSVSSALAKGQVRLGAPAASAVQSLLNEASDHLWLEYRDKETWVALDSCVKDVPAGATPVDPLEVWDVLPAARFHRVTIRVVAEARRSAQLSTSALLRHEAAATELNDAVVVLTYTFSSAGAGGTTVRPQLQIDGRWIDGKAAAGTGVATGAPKLGERLFSRPGEPPSGGDEETTAEWVDFEFRYPSGRTEAVRRYVFDRIGPAARRSGTASTAVLSPLPKNGGVASLLGGIYALSFDSGYVQPASILARLTPHLAAYREVLPLAADGQRGKQPATKKETAQFGAKLEPLVPVLLSVAAAAFHVESNTSQLAFGDAGMRDVWFYHATPRLAIASLEIDSTSEDRRNAVLGLDLRRNSIRAVAEGMPNAELAWTNCMRGILDGVLEDLPFAALAHEVPRQLRAAGAVTMMQRAREAQIPFAVVTHADQVGRMKIRDHVKAQMLAALDGDAIVVSPTSEVELANRLGLAWWRIDLKSGEAVGMTDAGLHQGAFETLAEILDTMHPVQSLLLQGAIAFVLITGILAIAQLLQFLLCIGANPPAPGWWQQVPQRIPCIR